MRILACTGKGYYPPGAVPSSRSTSAFAELLRPLGCGCEQSGRLGGHNLMLLEGTTQITNDPLAAAKYSRDMLLASRLGARI